MISNHFTGFAMTTLPTVAGCRPVLLLGSPVRALGDAAAATPCGVLVDRAALGGTVEDARGLGDRALGCGAALLDEVARGLHAGARGRASQGLDRGAPGRLAHALQGGALLLLCCHRPRTI